MPYLMPNDDDDDDDDNNNKCGVGWGESDINKILH